MKKVLSIALCFVLMLSSVSLAEIDYSSYSDDELRAIISAANNELTKRHLAGEGDILLCDVEGISIYLTRKYSIEEANGGKKYIKFEVIAVNNSEHGLMFGYYSASVNGWDVGFSWSNVNASAGHKIRGEILFCISDAGINSFDEIETIEVRLGFGKSDALGTTDTGMLSINPKDF